MKKSIKYLFLSLVLGLTLTACGKEANSSDLEQTSASAPEFAAYDNLYNDSLNNAKSLTIKFAVTDSDTLIYSSYLLVDFNEDEFVETKTVKSLSSTSFTLEEKTTTATSKNNAKSDYLKLSFVNASNIVSNNNKITFDVAKEKVNDFMGANSDDIKNSNLNFKVLCVNNNMKSLVTSYETNTGFNCSYQIDFGYEEV